MAAGDCRARWQTTELAAIVCQLPEGHPGEHECTTTITWTDSENAQ
jgi:hypothetical protein